MKPVVSLKDFVQEMSVFGYDFKTYLNIRTGEFVTISNEEIEAVESGESIKVNSWTDPGHVQKVEEVFESDDYKALPDQFEIHEYSIMESYCYSIEDDELRHRLIGAIRGRGAFRYFKDLVFEYGIRDEWFAYRDQAFKEIAINWLERHGVAYIDEEADN
jgi:hypothetical protein